MEKRVVQQGDEVVIYFSDQVFGPVKIDFISDGFWYFYDHFNGQLTGVIDPHSAQIKWIKTLFRVGNNLDPEEEK